MNLIHYKLLDFLEKFDCLEMYKTFREQTLTLCGLTKCRIDPNHKQGYESCFLFLALQQNFAFKRFLEFGTGRGTTSFLMACCHNIERVVTLDIVPHNLRRATWCDYQRVIMSNAEIHDKCVEAIGEPRAPIERICANSTSLTPSRIKGGPFDLVYIDGSHDYGPVKSDFELTKALLADDAVVIFDDYDPRYGVHQAVNEIMADEDCLLVSVNGHIYGPEQEPDECGHIIWARGKYKELLHA